jgi:LysM repeat protein
MRRTTICRSEHRAALLALVAGLLAGRAPALAAQDTTHARPDTSQRAPDTSQAAPAQTPGLQGQLPATHVVVAGETLWSIAQLYFNDPLLWPEIYRLNTSIIDDPHWVYPGEELNLAAGGLAQAPDTTPVAVAPQVVGDTVRAQPAPLPPADTVKATAPVAVTAPPETTTVALDTTQSVEAVPPPPEPSVTYLTVFERRRTAGQQVREVLKAYANRPYRPLRRGEFYAAGFLTEEEDLPYGRVIGNTALPAIPRFTDRTSALPFDQLAISPAHNASYHVGDSLLIVRIDRDIANWGKVVVPTAVVRVTELQRRQVLADVIMQFNPVHDGQLVLPLEPFKDPGQVRPTPVEQGLEGTVIAARDLHVLPGPQQILFINRGRAEGVSPGDVFEVFKPATGTSSEQVQMTIEIVHTRDHSASGLVLNIDRPHLVPGMPVRLIRKMPS